MKRFLVAVLAALTLTAALVACSPAVAKADCTGCCCQGMAFAPGLVERVDTVVVKDPTWFSAYTASYVVRGPSHGSILYDITFGRQFISGQEHHFSLFGRVTRDEDGQESSLGGGVLGVFNLHEKWDLVVEFGGGSNVATGVDGEGNFGFIAGVAGKWNPKPVLSVIGGIKPVQDTPGRFNGVAVGGGVVLYPNVDAVLAKVF